MPPGRPTALNQKLIEQIADIMRTRQCTYAVAAGGLGVPRSTALSWLAKGREADGRREAALTPSERKEQGLPTAQADRLFLELLDTVEQAKATAVLVLHQQLIEHGGEARNWQALKYVLGVLSEDYKETKRTELTGADGGPVKSESTMSPAALQALAAGLMPVPVAPVAPVLLDDEDGAEDGLSEDEQDDLL